MALNLGLLLEEAGRHRVWLGILSRCIFGYGSQEHCEILCYVVVSLVVSGCPLTRDVDVNVLSSLRSAAPLRLYNLLHNQTRSVH